MIKVGIIGCGKIAQVRHIPEYLSNPNAEIVGYYDLNFQRARELALKFGGQAYASPEALLAEEGIDAVSVCVANAAHAEMTIAALDARKHVLCEKPMAMTLAQCEAMVNAAQRNERSLMIGQNQRLTQTHKKAKELIARGEIGEIVSFRSVFGHSGPETWGIEGGKDIWFFDKKRAGMGAMADLGIHKTDLMRYLLSGRQIVEVRAALTTVDKRDTAGNLISVDDNALCILRLDNGAIGTVCASWTYYGEEDNSTVIYGTEGILRLYTDPQYSLILDKKSGEKAYYCLDKIQTNAAQTSSGVIDAFIEGLQSGNEPLISGEDVLRSMRVVFACLDSAKSGAPVVLWDETRD